MNADGLLHTSIGGMIALLLTKFMLNDLPHAASITECAPMVTLYHETSLKPEIIRREGLRPPRPDYTLGLLARQLGIPLSSIDANWLKAVTEDPIFYDYLYGPEPGVSKRTRKNLFFWMYKPLVRREVGIASPGLERLALEMVHNSSVYMKAEQVRSRLFTDVPSIVTVRIPGSWIWSAKPGFVEWLIGAQSAGEKVDIEVEVGRPIPSRYILNIERGAE